MSRLTMSGLPRFMICQASAALPQIGRASEEGARGTAIHNAIEGTILRPDVEGVAIEGGEPIDLAPIRGWFPTLDGLMIEPKVAYDVEGRLGRRISLEGARNYGALLESEIPGSADLALWHDGVLWLADIKTGYHVDAFAGGAAGNWQLRGLALGLASLPEILDPIRAQGIDTGFVHVRACLMKVREDGSVDIDEATWSPADMDDFAEELATAWRRRRPEAAVMSQWCGYCPSLMSCPATKQAVGLLRTPEVVNLATRIQEAPPVRVAEALTAARHLRKVIDAVEERARLLAREGLLPGYRLVERERREVHGGVAFSVLTERHGRDVAQDAIEVTTSQTAIRDALRGVAERAKAAGEKLPRGWLGAEVAAVLEAVEGQGGIETKSFEVLIADRETP